MKFDMVLKLLQMLYNRKKKSWTLTVFDRYLFVFLTKTTF